MKLTSTSRMISSEIAANPANAKDSRCLNISNMVLAALPTIAFGVFTIIFTMQQNRAANENRKQDQQQADEQSIRVTFENYINDISKLLLDLNFNRSNTEHLLHIRVKTMTVLRYVDANRKRDIVLFLYESRLLRSDMPASERLNLIGADLGELQFIGRQRHRFNSIISICLVSMHRMLFSIGVSWTMLYSIMLQCPMLQ